MEASKCPKCGEEPHFLEHIDKWYCYGCNAYIDDGVEHACADEVKNDECAEAIKEELKALDQEPRIECRKCGAEIEGLKDGKLFCTVCESFQDETAAPPEAGANGTNDAQKLLDEVLSQPPQKPEVQVAPAPVEPKPEPVPEPELAPAQPVAEQPVAVPASSQVRMCPACGQALKWIEKYQRHYCYGCKKYAPKEVSEKPPVQTAPAHVARACPGCGGELKFVEKYSEYYCYACKKYPLREQNKAEPPKAEQKTAAEPKAEAPKEPVELRCPKCNGELRWIEKYSRHYCNSCKEYAPKGFGGAAGGSGEKKVCPLCKEPMKFVAEYNEWYCYKCKKYSLRPSKPVLLI
jgi:predicted RNA-binding Zn-ribbon protein involved in translation (DUF1610 family)